MESSTLIWRETFKPVRQVVMTSLRVRLMAPTLQRSKVKLERNSRLCGWEAIVADNWAGYIHTPWQRLIWRTS